MSQMAVSDIAYTILVYENSKEVKDKELKIEKRKMRNDIRSQGITRDGGGISKGKVTSGQMLEECITKNY